MTDDSMRPSPEDRAGDGVMADPTGQSGGTAGRSGGGADLSKLIEGAVDREAGDEVRCTKVGADTYRCNWWAVACKGGYDNPAMRGGQLATDHRIRKSQFLRVTKGRAGLKITEVPVLPRE